VGSLLAGDADLVERARDVRKLLGGGMRQAGVVAGPAIEALDDVDRLATDHENAAVLADGLAEIDGLDVTPPETNIVIADVSGLGLTSHEFLDVVAEADVLATEMGEHLARFVTHRDVDRAAVETAVERVQEAV
jgi:threonine aldolase